MMNESEMWARAEKCIPGGSTTFSKFPNQFAGNYPKFAESGYKNHLYCSDGKSYLDFMSALGPAILGYNNKDVNEAIKNQVDLGSIFSLPTVLEADVAELIIKYVPCAEKVKFGKNGSDATIAAIRAARAFTKNDHVARCGYNGWGDSFTDFRPLGVPSEFHKFIHNFEYNNLDSLEETIRKFGCKTIIMEPVSLTRPLNGYLENVRELANAYKCVLIFDEMITGFRWSLGGAQQYYNVIPDMATFGKAICNGMPLSVVCGKSDIMEMFNSIAYSATFFGECLSLAAAKATIGILANKDYSEIWEMGNKFKYGMNKLAKKHGLKIDLQGEAPRTHLEFDHDTYLDHSGMKTLFFQKMCEHNILFSNVLYITFAWMDYDIDDVLSAADKSFAFVAEHQNNIDSVLIGDRIGEVYRKNA